MAAGDPSPRTAAAGSRAEQGTSSVSLVDFGSLSNDPGTNSGLNEPTLLVVQLVAVMVAEPTPRMPTSTARTMPLARTSARNSRNQELHVGGTGMEVGGLVCAEGWDGGCDGGWGGMCGFVVWVGGRMCACASASRAGVHARQCCACAAGPSRGGHRPRPPSVLVAGKRGRAWRTPACARPACAANARGSAAPIPPHSTHHQTHTPAHDLLAQRVSRARADGGDDVGVVHHRGLQGLVGGQGLGGQAALEEWLRRAAGR